MYSPTSSGSLSPPQSPVPRTGGCQSSPTNTDIKRLQMKGLLEEMSIPVDSSAISISQSGDIESVTDSSNTSSASYESLQ